jgi:hypothetical protein
VLVTYPAYTLTGTTVCFYIDTSLTSLLPGRYIGAITVKGNACGQVEMDVGDKCSVFTPYTVSSSHVDDNDFQPAP